MSTLNLENIKHPDSASNNISVDSSGRTGVGTATPSATLHVEGGSNTQMRVSSTGAEANLTLNGGSYAQINNTTGTLYVTNDTASNIEMRTASTTRLKVDGSGRVTMPYQPAFYARGDGGGGQNSGTTEVMFPSNNAPAFNDGNHYSYSTYRFTAPVAGKYLFTTSLYTNGGNDFQIRMAINGSYANTAGPMNQDLAQPYGDHGYITKTLTVILKLSANDYVSVLYSSGMQVYTDGDTQFSGYLIG